MDGFDDDLEEMIIPLNNSYFNLSGPVVQQATSSSSSRPDEIYTTFFVLAVVCIPVIVITNLAVIVTTILVKKLQTPDNYIITGIAVADLLVGIWNLPVWILYDIEETKHLIRTYRWTCVMRFVAVATCGGLSLSLIFLLCIDRFIALNWPFWFRKHVTKRVTILAIVVVFILELTRAIGVYVFAMRFDESEPSLSKRCSYHRNVPRWYRLYFLPAKQGVQLSICTCICLNLTVLALTQMSKRKRDLHYRDAKQRSEFKNKMTSVKITVSLMFLFIVLWAPYLLITPVKELLNSYNSTIYSIFTRISRMSNSFLNTLVYALSKPTYRAAYWYLLTTPPWRWAGLPDFLRAADAQSGVSSNQQQGRSGHGMIET